MSKPAQSGTHLGLSKKMKKVAEMLANPDFQGTKTDILREAGVPRSTFYRWLRENQEFTDYVTELVEKYTDGELAFVWKALTGKCQSGDVSAIKLYFELKGKYKLNVDIDSSPKLSEIFNQIGGEGLEE